MEVPIYAEVWTPLPAVGRAASVSSPNTIGASIALNESLSAQIITGRREILALHGLLMRLSERCDQKGAMDHLEYFLTSEESLKKLPHLVLIGENQHLPGAEAEQAVGALLIYEYRLLGWRTGIYSTDDTTGRRTLIAPPASRLLMARLAAELLMQQGAKMTMQSMLEAPDVQTVVKPVATPKVRNNWMYGTRRRMIPSYLPLESTMDATLATIGQKTRSNLRYYRRRAEAQLGSYFVERVVMSRFEFKAFNRRCSYAVTDELAGWRYDVLDKVPGMFLCGIKGGDGEWLSMIGGRRYHDIVEIDWQMNRDDLPAHSLSTVMRSYFIEHEVSLGTQKMYIEGGTPHAMRFSFATDVVRDIVLVRGFLMLPMLRRLARRVLPKTNFVTAILTEDQMKWMPWSCV